MIQKMLATTYLFACLTAPALAEGEGFDYERNPQGSWFVAPKVEAIYIDLPSYAPVIMRNGNAHSTVTVDDGDELGFNGGLKAGFSAGDALGLGGQLWIEAGAQAALFTSEDNFRGFNPGPGMNFQIINYNGGPPNNGANLSASGGSLLDAERDTWIFRGEILGRYEFDADGFTISPFVGPEVMVIWDDTSSRAVRPDGSGERYKSNEDVVSAYYGGKLGIEAAGHFSPHVGWTLGAHGSAYYLDASFDGEQNSTYTATGNGTFVSNVSDDDSKFAFGGGLEAGLFFWLGGVRTTFSGGVDYLSDVGAMDTARRPAPGATAKAADLRFDDSFMFRGGLEFMIPLN